jgi:hypothetical protein
LLLRFDQQFIRRQIDLARTFLTHRGPSARTFLARRTMQLNDPAKVLAWLRRRPSEEMLKNTFPDEWEAMEAELAAALAGRDQARLHRLLHPDDASGKNKLLRMTKADQARALQAAIRQRMAALAIQRYSLAIATGQTSGKVRFNLFNGLIAQRLLFRRGFERKPVSLFWFRLLWPLLWQKRLLMPLVERKGIYCFYSQPFMLGLRDLIARRSCVEIGAGDGTLTRFLNELGVPATATDDYSWADRISYPASVVRLDAAAALAMYLPQVVLCSWPPAGNSFEKTIFRSRSVEMYIVILSRHRFASGNWEAYEAQQDFTLEHRPDLAGLLLPPELESDVLVFTRKTRAAG